MEQRLDRLLSGQEQAYHLLMGVGGAPDCMATALEPLAMTLGPQVVQQELTNTLLCQLLEFLP